MKYLKLLIFVGAFSAAFGKGSHHLKFREVFSNVDFSEVKEVILDAEYRELFEERIELSPDVCTICEAFFDPVITDVQNGGNFTYWIEIAIDICVTLDIGSVTFCEDFLYMIEPELEFVFSNTTNLTSNDWCGTFLVSEGCISDNPARNWTLTLNESKPEPYDPPYDNSVETMKILHLGDTHYDPLYVPYSNAICPEKYLCCRGEESGTVENPEDAAGFWGDFRECDSPKWLLELMYSHIAEQHPDIDFIIWTGDLVSHNIWSTSRESNVQTIWDTADLISEYFPNIKAYPTLGNHEGSPVNSFPQPYIGDPFDISWLYSEVEEVWSRWLDSGTSETILYGGYYSQEIMPGLRILSVNSNFCEGYNWWLVVDSYDVAQTLTFMADELQKAENKGESVYIIQHMNVGSGGCSLTWSHEYNRIINRYENTISGMFFGHSHSDRFFLFFDLEDIDRVYEVGYIGGSQTPYTDLNPGYKVYTIEGNFTGSRHRVLDHEGWILDLDLANSVNATDLFRLYSAREEYELVDTSPQSWYDLVYRMDRDNNSVLFDLYYRNMHKASSVYLASGCDSNCKYNNLCDTLTYDNTIKENCDVLITAHN